MHDVNATVYSACFFCVSVCVCDIFISIWKKYHAGGPAKGKIKMVWPNIKILVLYKNMI